MAKWYIPNFVEGRSAIVSTHGWFRIMDGPRAVEQGIPPVYFAGGTTLFEGSVEHLGIDHYPETDDISVDDVNGLTDRLRKFYARRKVFQDYGYA